MPRTVLGWRCRWGSGRSLPTSYTSPQAANKPLIVFPIHTDRGRHCLSGFTPCLSHGPWFTPPKNYGLFIQFYKPQTEWLQSVGQEGWEQKMAFNYCWVWIVGTKNNNSSGTCHCQIEWGVLLLWTADEFMFCDTVNCCCWYSIISWSIFTYLSLTIDP